MRISDWSSEVCSSDRLDHRASGEFTSFVERGGRGDLTQQTRNTGSDELGRLGQFLNAMVGGLGQLARQSRDATGQLNAATSELQASARQQAASTSEQSAAIQQITSTLEEIAQSDRKSTRLNSSH